MKKYMIPFGMMAGGLLGLIIGLIINFAVPIVAIGGGALGIIVGSIMQLVINQTYPDEYFKKEKSAVNTSLFSESDVAYREAYTASQIYRDKKAEEDIDINDYISKEERMKQKKIRQEQMWRQQAQQAKMRRQTEAEEQRKKEAIRKGEAQIKRKLKGNIFDEAKPQKSSYKNRNIIEEDDD